MNLGRLCATASAVSTKSAGAGAKAKLPTPPVSAKVESWDYQERQEVVANPRFARNAGWRGQVGGNDYSGFQPTAVATSLDSAIQCGIFPTITTLLTVSDTGLRIESSPGPWLTTRAI